MEVLRGDALPNPLRWARGLWTLLRVVPLVTWSGGGLLIGVGLALPRGGLNALHVLLMVAGALLLQGFVTHAYNDIADWRSGTDPASPRIMSGGSHVIPRGSSAARPCS
jgi:1,4-dihydroxy-2-naphthoate octaprenyltransferase